MSNMDVRSYQRWSIASIMISRHHFYSTVTLNCQNLALIQQWNGVRFHLYAYMPHWKVLKHIIYVEYRCEKQSKVINSINHNIVIQNCQSLTQLQRWNSIRVYLYAYILNWKVLKLIIYVQYECEKQSKGVYRLNHNIMASFPLNSLPELPKSDSASVV